MLLQRYLLFINYITYPLQVELLKKKNALTYQGVSLHHMLFTEYGNIIFLEFYSSKNAKKWNKKLKFAL